VCTGALEGARARRSSWRPEAARGPLEVASEDLREALLFEGLCEGSRMGPREGLRKAIQGSSATSVWEV
jgi:hypothetical protein